MNKIIILIEILFSFSFSLQAQETGIFSLSSSGEKKILVTGSDTAKQYDKIILQFEQSLIGANINILDIGKTTKFIDIDKQLGTDIQKDPTTGKLQLTVLVIDGKYVIQGFPGKELPKENFLLKIGDQYTNQFHIKPLETGPPNQFTKLSYQPGYLLYDALYISKIWNKKELVVDTIKLILDYYKIDAITIKDNNYLNNTLIDLYNIRNKYSDEIMGSSTEKLSPAKLLTTIGGLDVTNIADGFAKFIVKRTKQELSIAFFQKFKDDLESFPDIKSVFPQTYRALSAIDKEIYMYQAYIQTLRECFEKDLASLPSNLPTIIDNHKEYFDSVPDLKATLLTGFYIAQSIQDKQHPGDIIENFPIDNLDELTSPNIKPSFQTLILLSTSLKNNTEGNNYWAQYTDIKKLYSDDNETFLKIYLGLLEQKAKIGNIVFKGTTNMLLWKIIDDSHDSLSIYLPKYKSFIKNIALKTQSLETKISGLNKIHNDSLLFENYYSVVSSSIELMRSLTQAENLPKFPKQLNLRNTISKYFDVAQTASDIVIDVNRRNYSSAIVNVVHIYDLAISKWNINKNEYEEAKEKLGEILSDDLITQAIQNGFLPFSVTAKYTNKQLFELQPYIDKVYYYNALKNSKFNKDAIEEIFKYGSFMATIVQAKNSDDVEAAIEAIALPSGSARIKRETIFNVSLNAYCGLFIGNEHIKGIDDSGEKANFINNYGVTAPIGISITKGKGSFVPFLGAFGSKHSWSHSLFLSAVDIGALASFRFKDDKTQTVPNIQLKDIISPGIFYSLGIPKSPLSLNVGWQVGPLLREVTPTQNNYSQSYSRFSASIVVDLPLLNFYTKSK